MNEFQERIGVGQPSHAFTTAKGKSPRRRPVIREEGEGRGTVGGYHLDHADGRVDAHAFPLTTTQGATAQAPGD